MGRDGAPLREAESVARDTIITTTEMGSIFGSAAGIGTVAGRAEIVTRRRRILPRSTSSHRPSKGEHVTRVGSRIAVGGPSRCGWASRVTADENDRRPCENSDVYVAAKVRSIGAAAALGIASVVAPLVTAPPHAHAGIFPTASAVAQAREGEEKEDFKVIKLPAPIKRRVDAGIDRLSDFVCSASEVATRRMNVDWSIEDVWLILVWNAAITKGRKTIYRALARWKESQEEKKAMSENKPMSREDDLGGKVYVFDGEDGEDRRATGGTVRKSDLELDAEFQKTDHFLRWVGRPMRVISWAMVGLYVNDVFGSVLKLDHVFQDGLGFDLGAGDAHVFFRF